MFAPGIWWIGLRVNLCGSSVQSRQMYSNGVRPLSVFSRRANLQAVTKSARWERNSSWVS